MTWHKDNITLPIAITGPLVLDDGVTATYHNDLKVTGRLPGTYTCQIKDDGDSVLDTLMDYDVLGMLLHCDWFELLYHYYYTVGLLRIAIFSQHV